MPVWGTCSLVSSRLVNAWPGGHLLPALPQPILLNVQAPPGWGPDPLHRTCTVTCSHWRQSTIQSWKTASTKVSWAAHLQHVFLDSCLPPSLPGPTPTLSQLSCSFPHHWHCLFPAPHTSAWQQMEQKLREPRSVLGLEPAGCAQRLPDPHTSPRTASARHTRMENFHAYKMTKFGWNFMRIA